MKHISPELMAKAASFFKVVGDETRMKILCSLSTDELCVNDIAAAVDMTKSAVSHQLSSLKKTRLIRYRKTGKVVYYSLNDAHIEDIFAKALEHIRHD